MTTTDTYFMAPIRETTTTKITLPPLESYIEAVDKLSVATDQRSGYIKGLRQKDDMFVRSDGFVQPQKRVELKPIDEILDSEEIEKFEELTKTDPKIAEIEYNPYRNVEILQTDPTEKEKYDELFRKMDETLKTIKLPKSSITRM